MVPVTLRTVDIHAHRRRFLNPYPVVLESHVNIQQCKANTCALTVGVIRAVVVVVSLGVIQAIVAAVRGVGVSGSVRVDVVRVIVAVHVSMSMRGAEWICVFDYWSSGVGIRHSRRCPGMASGMGQRSLSLPPEARTESSTRVEVAVSRRRYGANTE